MDNTDRVSNFWSVCCNEDWPKMNESIPLCNNEDRKTAESLNEFSRKFDTEKALFIIRTDTHNYKITGMLKQLKFRPLLRHVSVHARTIIRELFRAWLKLQL